MMLHDGQRKTDTQWEGLKVNDEGTMRGVSLIAGLEYGMEQWDGIWNGMMEWNMKWNSKHTQL